MKLNKRYRLKDPKTFISSLGATINNKRIAQEIEDNGGVFEVLRKTSTAIVGWKFPNENTGGVYYSEICGDFITTPEYKFFEEVIAEDFPIIQLTISSRNQARKAIETLKGLL